VITSLTLSYGTANGVAYLNGSKVLTTGSAFVFDGTNVGIGTSSPSIKLDIVGTAAQITNGAGASGSRVRFDTPASSGGSYMQLYKDLTPSYVAGIGTAVPGGSAASAMIFSDYQGSWVERMRIDSSGNLLVGGTSSVQRITSTKGISANDAADSGIAILRSGTTYGSNLYHTYNSANGQEAFGITVNNNTTLTDAQYTKYLTTSNGIHIWYGSTTSTERMRIDSSGRLLLGDPTVNGNLGATGFQITSAQTCQVIQCTDATGQAMRFYSSTSTQAGYITVNGATASYNSASDYRLKENVTQLVDGLSVISKLNPVKYTWKVDGNVGEGFIAHELQESIPLAVQGVKDQVDANGNIDPQGIDQSKIVPYLVKAIQEQQALITTLTARITALESKEIS